MTHGSGDFVIAFSTRPGSPPPDEKLTPLFEATVEATEEAAINSLFKVFQPRTGKSGTVNNVDVPIGICGLPEHIVREEPEAARRVKCLDVSHG